MKTERVEKSNKDRAINKTSSYRDCAWGRGSWKVCNGERISLFTPAHGLIK